MPTTTNSDTKIIKRRVLSRTSNDPNQTHNFHPRYQYSPYITRTNLLSKVQTLKNSVNSKGFNAYAEKLAQEGQGDSVTLTHRAAATGDDKKTDFKATKKPAVVGKDVKLDKGFADKEPLSLKEVLTLAKGIAAGDSPSTFTKLKDYFLKKIKQKDQKPFSQNNRMLQMLRELNSKEAIYNPDKALEIVAKYRKELRTSLNQLAGHIKDEKDLPAFEKEKNALLNLSDRTIFQPIVERCNTWKKQTDALNSKYADLSPAERDEKVRKEQFSLLRNQQLAEHHMTGGDAKDLGDNRPDTSSKNQQVFKNVLEQGGATPSGWTYSFSPKDNTISFSFKGQGRPKGPSVDELVTEMMKKIEAYLAAHPECSGFTFKIECKDPVIKSMLAAKLKAHVEGLGISANGLDECNPDPVIYRIIKSEYESTENSAKANSLNTQSKELFFEGIKNLNTTDWNPKDTITKMTQSLSADMKKENSDISDSDLKTMYAMLTPADQLSEPDPRFREIYRENQQHLAKSQNLADPTQKGKHQALHKIADLYVEIKQALKSSKGTQAERYQLHRNKKAIEENFIKPLEKLYNKSDKWLDQFGEKASETYHDTAQDAKLIARRRVVENLHHSAANVIERCKGSTAKPEDQPRPNIAG